ncbi:hypothetical protein R9X47_28595 [Wukongibacter baidiensis]|uniref:hypothetical protein n=1 Tax=Wukongibacter baidiensis TaxID=1723361 RepID=UPI003D7F63B4
MRKIAYIIATISFYIGSICFFSSGNKIAGVLDLFSGTCFLILYIKTFKKHNIG